MDRMTLEERLEKISNDLFNDTKRGGTSMVVSSTAAAIIADDKVVDVGPKFTMDWGFSEDESGESAWTNYLKAEKEKQNERIKKQKDLLEKYKLTPEEEHLNELIDKNASWGIGKKPEKLTPYKKAVEAEDPDAELIKTYQTDNFDGFAPENLLKLVRLQMPTLIGSGRLPIDLNTAERKDIIESIKKWSNENKGKPVPLSQKDVVTILDRFPDIFEDLGIDVVEEGVTLTNHSEEGSIRNKIFTEFPMQAPSDAIHYIKPVFSSNMPNPDPQVDEDSKFQSVTLTSDPISYPVEFNFDEYCERDAKLTQKLQDRMKEETKPVKEKLSWKKQQRNKPKWARKS